MEREYFFLVVVLMVSTAAGFSKLEGGEVDALSSDNLLSILRG